MVSPLINLRPKVNCCLLVGSSPSLGMMDILSYVIWGGLKSVIHGKNRESNPNGRGSFSSQQADWSPVFQHEFSLAPCLKMNFILCSRGSFILKLDTSTENKRYSSACDLYHSPPPMLKAINQPISLSEKAPFIIVLQNANQLCWKVGWGVGSHQIGQRALTKQPSCAVLSSSAGNVKALHGFPRLWELFDHSSFWSWTL